jgi:sigma-E factor negative regulatory protein RseA
MNTTEMTQEQISAFADGESADSQVDVVLASLQHAEGRTHWDLYHQIGDVLRSDDMDIALSSDFAARMTARLDAEPTIVAPAVALSNAASGHRSARRWSVRSMVAAVAVATGAFVITPQLMTALEGDAVVADVEMPAVISEAEQPVVRITAAPDGVVLRDPRIDDYLLAHQRFSPSVYSTAQYARSATFSSK